MTMPLPMLFARCLCALALMSCVSASAQEKWRPETFRLDNGMTFVVLPDHRAPVVTHMVWYRVGAAHETAGKSGLAHLFEHLMFKGTKDIAAGEFSRIVARNGGRDNAFTSHDYTAYFQRAAKDRLPVMMELEAGRMTGLTLSEADVLPERDVVKEERRQRLDNNPRALLYEKAMAALYRDHPYAIPVIGLMDEVAALDRADALDFYARMYGPQNAIVVVAGDITARELRPLAQRTYGRIAQIAPPLEASLPDVPPLADSIFVMHTDVKVRQPELTFYWLGTHATDPDKYALEALMRLLGGGRTSYLFRRLVEAEKLAVTASAGTSGGSRASGYLSVHAVPSPNVSTQRLEKAVADSIADFLRHGPDPEELRRVKSNMIAQAIYVRDSQSAMANWFGQSLTLGMSIDDILSRTGHIEAITPADVARVAREYITRPHHLSAYLLAEQRQ